MARPSLSDRVMIARLQCHTYSAPHRPSSHSASSYRRHLVRSERSEFRGASTAVRTTGRALTGGVPFRRIPGRASERLASSTPPSSSSSTSQMESDSAISTFPSPECDTSRRRQCDSPPVRASPFRLISSGSSAYLPERRSLLVPTLSLSSLFICLSFVALVATTRGYSCTEEPAGASDFVLSCTPARGLSGMFFAAAQETEDDSHFSLEDSGESEGEIDESDDYFTDENTDAATHRIYHHGDKYYRAVPLADLGGLLRGIRASLPENMLSDQEWYEVTDEISTKLELLDRRMYPQSLLEAIADNEAMEQGALVTPLADEELTEEGARAYELEKTAEAVREVLRAQLGLNFSPPVPSSSSSSSIHSHTPVVPGDAEQPSHGASASATSHSFSLDSQETSESEQRPPEAVSGGRSSEGMQPGTQSSTAVVSSEPSTAHVPGAAGASLPDTVGSAPGGGSPAGSALRAGIDSQASVSSPSVAILPPHASGVAQGIQDSTSEVTEKKTENRGDEREGGDASRAAEQRTDLGDGQPLKLGKVAFRPGDYEYLILRMSKPSKFRGDFRGSAFRDRRGPFDRRAHRRKRGSRLTRGPSVVPTEESKQLNDFGEFYVLLHALLSHHRTGFPKTNPLPDPPAFLFEKRAAQEGVGRQSSSDNDMSELVSELNSQLGQLSRENLRKLRAEAFGACAFLSFFGFPDEEGRLQLPGGWPRDLELALQCVVEGNKNRQFCATCFLIDGLATALGFPPVVARSDAWAVSHEAGVKSLYVLHRRQDEYKAPGLLEEQTGSLSDRRSALEGKEEMLVARSKTLKTTFDNPLIKYEMAAQMGDARGKLVTAYYLRTGLGSPDYRYNGDKQAEGRPNLSEDYQRYAASSDRLRKSRSSIERFNALKPSGESCIAALKHVVEVGSDATEFGSLQVLPQFLLRKGLVTTAYQHADFTANNSTSPLTKISVAAADAGESNPGGAGSASSEDYALLVQSLAEDGNPSGLTALGDLYFHGHEAGGIPRDVNRATELWLSAAAMGDASAAMALAFLLLGDPRDLGRDNESAGGEGQNASSEGRGGATGKSSSRDVSEKGSEDDGLRAESGAVHTVNSGGSYVSAGSGSSATSTHSASSSPSSTSASVTHSRDTSQVTGSAQALEEVGAGDFGSVLGFGGVGSLFSTVSSFFRGAGGTEEAETGSLSWLSDGDFEGTAPGSPAGQTIRHGGEGTGVVGSLIGRLFGGSGEQTADKEQEGDRTTPEGGLDSILRARKKGEKHPAEPFLKQVIRDGEGSAPHLARYLAYRLGIEGYTNTTLAGESLKTAAELGDSNAQMLYANAHMSGVRPSSITAYPSAFFPNGTDISVAFDYYTKAAEQGRLEALFNVGILTLQGAGVPTASSVASSTPQSGSASSSPSGDTLRSSLPVSLSHNPENPASRRSIVDRCVDAFAILQKVAFTHPSVAVLHEMVSRAFMKNDLTGALLASVLLSELGHISGHVNAAALWPRVTMRRGNLKAGLMEMLQEVAGKGRGSDGSLQKELVTQRGPDRRVENGKKKPEGRKVSTEREKVELGCKPTSSFSLDPEFLLPQADYLDSPTKAILSAPQKASRASFFPSSWIFASVLSDSSAGLETAGANPGHSGHTVTSEEKNGREHEHENCPAPSRFMVYLRHLRVSEFLRCWARPHGESGWLEALQEDFPFLKESRFLEPSRVLHSLEQAEKEGNVCSFYFLRRAAAEGDVTSMLDLSAAYDQLALRHRERQLIVESTFRRRFERMKHRGSGGRAVPLGKGSHASAEEYGGLSLNSDVPLSGKGDRFAAPEWIRQMLEKAEAASLSASFFWRTSAGERKDGRALLELGQALEMGKGVAQNRTEAYKLYWGLVTDSKHSVSSRFLGVLALGRTTLSWLHRRVFYCAVQVYKWVNRVYEHGNKSPRTSLSGHDDAGDRPARATPTHARQKRSGGGQNEPSRAKSSSDDLGADDDPAPLYWIYSWRVLEQVGSEGQSQVWSRLLVVYILVFLASVVAVLTAAHARWLTSTNRSRSPATASPPGSSGATRDGQGSAVSSSQSNIQSPLRGVTGDGLISRDLSNRLQEASEDSREGEEGELRMRQEEGNRGYRSSAPANADFSADSVSKGRPLKSEARLTGSSENEEVDAWKPSFGDANLSRHRVTGDSRGAGKEQEAPQRAPPGNGREDIAVLVSGRVCGVPAEDGEAGQNHGLRRRPEWQERAARGTE